MFFAGILDSLQSTIFCMAAPAKKEGLPQICSSPIATSPSRCIIIFLLSIVKLSGRLLFFNYRISDIFRMVSDSFQADQKVGKDQTGFD